jgi:hypothetical protein
VIDRAARRLDDVRPRFSTFVHGDPNPENVMWRSDPSGNFTFRLIDPKDWWTGDYLFDVAKLIHYIRVTSPVQHLRLATEHVVDGTVSFYRYDAGPLDPHHDAVTQLVDLVGTFAGDNAHPDVSGWRVRLDLAIAANLLGIAGPRLMAAAQASNDADRHLGIIALGEGLSMLMTA